MCGWLILRLLYIFCLFVGLWFCVSMCNNYVTYIVTMRLYFNQLQTAALNAGAATMSSLAQLRVWDIKKQRQCRCDDVKLTKSGIVRSDQLLVMPTMPLTNWEWLPGEHLSGLKTWLFFFLDMTSFSSRCMLELKIAVYDRATSLYVLTGFFSRGMSYWLKNHWPGICSNTKSTKDDKTSPGLQSST